MNAKLIALATTSSLLIGYTVNALETPYKTSGNQIVVTGLNPRQTYSVQTTDNQGREGYTSVTSNECGYVVINNGSIYQRLTINSQTIRPEALSSRGYPNCNPQWNPNDNNRQQLENK